MAEEKNQKSCCQKILRIAEYKSKILNIKEFGIHLRTSYEVKVRERMIPEIHLKRGGSPGGAGTFL